MLVVQWDLSPPQYHSRAKKPWRRRWNLVFSDSFVDGGNCANCQPFEMLDLHVSTPMCRLNSTPADAEAPLLPGYIECQLIRMPLSPCETISRQISFHIEAVNRSAKVFLSRFGPSVARRVEQDASKRAILCEVDSGQMR